MKEISSEQYLKRLEDEKNKLPESEIDAALARLNIPFREVAYGEQGTEKVEADGFTFEFSYSPLNTLEQKEDIQRRMARVGVGQEVLFANPLNWRKLNTFLVTIGKRRANKLV